MATSHSFPTLMHTSLHTMDDLALVTMCQQAQALGVSTIGEVAVLGKLAYAELCKRYEPLLLKHCKGMHINTIREDMYSHLWTVFLEAIHDFDIFGDTPFAGYINSKIRFGQWNYFKQNRHQWRHEVIPWNTLDVTMAGDDGTDSIHYALTWQEHSNTICRVWHQLSEKERQVLYYMYVQRRSVTDISRLLHCSRQNVYYFHNKAIKLFQKRMKLWKNT